MVYFQNSGMAKKSKVALCSERSEWATEGVQIGSGGNLKLIGRGFARKSLGKHFWVDSKPASKNTTSVVTFIPSGPLHKKI